MAKKRQRGNGAGTVYPRKNRDGKVTSYRGSYFAPDGKRRYVSAKRKGDAERALRDAMTDADRGLVFDASNQSVSEYMTHWLEDFAKANLASRTYHNYKLQIREHIVPAFGKMKLSKLDTPNIQALYTVKLQDGLKPASVRYIHAVLRCALEKAVDLKLIARNPAASARPPRIRQEEITPLDVEQVQVLLEAAKGDRFECLYVLSLMCGVRMGESLGLRWSDVDLEAGSLRIHRQLQRVREGGGLVFSEPKNASRRTIDLPQRTLEALISHRRRQLELQLRAGAKWQDNDLVFSTTIGTAVDAQNVVNRHFKPLLKRAGLPPVRFHDLRHSCLSLLAQRGEPIRDLQALAGHATAAFTLQRYTHHYDSSARRTADTMGDILPDEP